jgi:hypothetical protein
MTYRGIFYGLLFEGAAVVLLVLLFSALGGCAYTGPVCQHPDPDQRPVTLCDDLAESGPYRGPLPRWGAR